MLKTYLMFNAHFYVFVVADAVRQLFFEYSLLQSILCKCDVCKRMKLKYLINSVVFAFQKAANAAFKKKRGESVYMYVCMHVLYVCILNERVVVHCLN